jgi:hypothetical protein
MNGGQLDERFVVPVDINFVGFRIPAGGGRLIEGELRVTPLQVVDEHLRASREPVQSVSRDDDTLVMVQNDNTFPESQGFWTRGHARALVSYAWPASAGSSRQLRVSCGAVANDVTLSTPGWSEQLVVNSGETKSVTVPGVEFPGLQTRVAPLAIDVARGFVPADVDRSVADRRFLGCWIVLEHSATAPRIR